MFTSEELNLLCTSKHRRWISMAFARRPPETFKGLGLSQQTAFCPQRAIFSGIVYIFEAFLQIYSQLKKQSWTRYLLPCLLRICISVLLTCEDTAIWFIAFCHSLRALIISSVENTEVLKLRLRVLSMSITLQINDACPDKSKYFSSSFQLLRNFFQSKDSLGTI